MPERVALEESRRIDEKPDTKNDRRTSTAFDQMKNVVGLVFMPDKAKGVSFKVKKSGKDDIKAEIIRRFGEDIIGFKVDVYDWKWSLMFTQTSRIN